MTPRQPIRSGARRLRAMRRLITTLVGFGVCAALVDTWLVQGLFAPIIVASGSMAPTWLGPHRQWRCTRCTRDFASGLESLPAPGAAAVCPNCGAENDPQEGVVRRGDRVLVDRSAFLWRSPRRWEAVVFRCPEEPRTLCVKRVVGLPGEKVQIQQGDVFIDGAIAQKELARQRTMAVNVYDTLEGDHRWQSASPAWQCSGTHFVHRGRTGEASNPWSRRRRAEPVDWLTYHHRRHVAEGEQAGPIRDESPCDQNESRELTAVADLMLRCELQARGNGMIVLRATSRDDQFTLVLDAATGEGELRHNGRIAAIVTASLNPFGSFARLEWLLADRRVQLAIDESLLLDYDYQSEHPLADGAAPAPADSQGRSADQPLAVGVGGAQVELRNLQILRDVYYTSGNRRGDEVVYQLGPDEYFVLGDNSPHALDSRGWSQGAGLSGTLLVGKVLEW